MEYYSNRRVFLRGEFMAENIRMNEIICFDTETTGIDSRAEILQLSILDGTGAILFDELIRPCHTAVWPEAERVHHISPAMVSDRNTMEYFQGQIVSILENAKVYVGYNVIFDIRMLKYAGFSMAPFHRDGVQVIDVMKNFAPIYGEWNSAKGQYRWQKLTTCAAYYDYDWGNEKAHGALADTKATLHCFKRMNNLHL